MFLCCSVKLRPVQTLPSPRLDTLILHLRSIPDQPLSRRGPCRPLCRIVKMQVSKSGHLKQAISVATARRYLAIRSKSPEALSTWTQSPGLPYWAPTRQDIMRRGHWAPEWPNQTHIMTTWVSSPDVVTLPCNGLPSHLLPVALFVQLLAFDCCLNVTDQLQITGWPTDRWQHYKLSTADPWGPVCVATIRLQDWPVCFQVKHRRKEGMVSW